MHITISIVRYSRRAAVLMVLLFMATVTYAQTTPSDDAHINAAAPSTNDGAVTAAKAPSKTSAEPTKPLWQDRLKSQESDFIEFLPKDRVLLGTIDISIPFYGLEPHEIVLLNSVTGNTVWAVPRGSFGFPQTLLAVDPVILLAGSKQYAALNPGNGAVVWTRNRAGEEALLLPEHDLIVLYAYKKSLVSVSAVNVKTGSEVWTASLENYPEEKLGVRATIVGEAVVLLGPEVAAFSAANGKLLWRMPFPGTFGAKAAAISLGDDLYFTDSSSVTRKNSTSGRDLWHQAFADGTPRNLTGDERNVFLLKTGSGEDQPDVVEALEHNTGKTLWKLALPEQATSPITIERQRLYVTTPSNLVVIDAVHGSLVFKAPIPSNLRSQRELPAILRVTNSRIIVAKENGVMAVQEDDGKLLFAEHVMGGEGFTYDYSVNRLNHAVLSEAPLNKRLEAFATQQKSQMNLIVYGTGQPIPGAQAGRTAVVGSSIVAGLTGLVSVAETMWMTRRMGVLHAEVNQTLETHANSLQDKFYVRPCYEQDRGWFLHVVDLETGKHTDIILSPDNEVPAPFAANLPAFSAGGFRIVSKGLGLNPERVERRYGIRARYVITYPSILAFDLAALPLEEQMPLAKAVDPEKKKLNDQLINAAYRSDLGTIQKALESGADVNAVDEYGQTALMLAAESAKAYNKTDVVEFLLQRGADAAKRDPGGLTALEHMYLLAAGVEGKKSVFNVRKMIEKAQREHK